MGKKAVKVDVSSIDESVELESVEDVFDEPIEVKPVKVENKQDIYRAALVNVLDLIQTGAHPETIMKHINAVLK